MSFLAFIGGAGKAYNASKQAERDAMAEEKKLARQREHEMQMLDVRLGKEYEWKEKEAERQQKAKEAQYNKRLAGAYAEMTQLQQMETEEQPYLSMSGEYPTVKMVKLGDKKLTEEEATSMATRQNVTLKDSGYLSIALPRDDGRGWKTVVKEAKDLKTPEGFGTTAEAQSYADEQLAYYDKLGIKNMIPLFETNKDNRTTVKFAKPEKGVGPSSLYDTMEEATAAADKVNAYYDGKPDLKGKFAAKIKQTDKGFSVESVQLTAQKVDTTEKEPSTGLLYDTNFLFARSPKVGGPKLAEKRGDAYDAVSLTGERVLRTGKAQATQIEGQDYLILQKNGIGETAAERVENHAGAIQRDLTPEVVQRIVANKDTPAGGRAYQAMISTFRNFVNSYKSANTTALTDRVIITPIEDKHAWLSGYMKMDGGIKEVLSQDLAPRAAGGTPVAELMPINEPVKASENGIERMARPNLASSTLVEEIQDPNDPGKTVKKYADTFMSGTQKLVQGSGLGQATILDVLETAIDPMTGESSPEASEQAYYGMQTLRKKFEAAGEFVVNEGGTRTFQVPAMATNTKIAIMSDVNRFSDHNNRIIAIQATLPPVSTRVANSQLKDNSAKGRYTAVTGAGMKFTTVSEQLENGKEMMGSIDGLQQALVKDRATGEQGEVGLVLNVERLASGVGYMFETLGRTLVTDDDVDRDGLFKDLKNKIDSAVAETDTEKKNNALVKLYGTMLSYQLARLMDPNGRLSDEDRRTVEDGIGVTGIMANPDAVLALTEELRGKVDYVIARNTAYMSNNTSRILAAHVYDNLSEGGNFRKAFYDAFEINQNMIGKGPRGATGTPTDNSGVTVDPAFAAFQSMIQQENQAAQQVTPAPQPTVTPTPAPQPAQTQQPTPAPAAPVTLDEIPIY